MMGATTSTNGKGADIIESIRGLVGQGVDQIELAIGPRPVDDFMSWWSSSGLIYTRVVQFRGHDAMPIGDGHTMRPEATDGLERIADRLHAMGVRHYSMHPPDKKVLPTLDSLFDWYLDKRQIFKDAGILFALETMYFNPNRPHNLVGLEDVYEFAHQTARLNIVSPLVLDLAHIRINVQWGKWPNPLNVEMMMAESPWMEIHVSSNNGRLDQHRPYDPQRDEDIEAWLQRLSPHIPRISEGRIR